MFCQLERIKPGEDAAAPPQRAASGGIRGCVRKYLFDNMLDAVPGSFKILICDASAAAMLNSCVRMHELMEHGVTLLEDLMEQRQPIITSPALYFFDPTDASVDRIIEDWYKKDPYKEVHIFALSTTPQRYLHQLAHARISSKVISFKDMMLDFYSPETLVFHLNMQNEFLPLLSPSPPLSRESVLDVAASRLLSVFHAINNGFPIIRYQHGSNICQWFASLFSEKLERFGFDMPEFKNGGGGNNSNNKNPILVIVDRSFDTTTPLLHHRTYQCLIEDLLSLNDNMYVQTYVNRSGEESTRQQPLDEDDFYWCLYRHRFFANCLEELPATLKKLHSDNPRLAQGAEGSLSVAELGSAVRSMPEFWEKQGKLSMHIDICTKIMSFYRAQRLAEVCEVEQDIAAQRKPFKVNLENVGRLAADVGIPEQVRLRLVLLFFSASDSSEFSEARKKQLILGSNLMAHADRFANLARVTSRAGKLLMSGDKPGSDRDFTVATGSAEGDPFVTQAYLIMEAIAKNALSTADYPFLGTYPCEAGAAAWSGNGVLPGPTAAKKTLRVGLSLAGLRREGGPWAVGASGSNGAGGGDKTADDTTCLRKVGRDEDRLDLGGGEGVISLSNTQRIVVFVLGGLTFAEMRAAYEASKKFGREVIIGGTSVLRPDLFLQELDKLQ